VAQGASPFSADYALCNSFGFGGTNGSLLFASELSITEE
jgi:3-oxoacyl-[acyl-carrier-protein] synthase II